MWLESDVCSIYMCLQGGRSNFMFRVMSMTCRAITEGLPGRARSCPALDSKLRVCTHSELDGVRLLGHRRLRGG